MHAGAKKETSYVMTNKHPDPHAVFKSESAQRISQYPTDHDWRRTTDDWLRHAFSNRYMYNFYCLGRPIIQLPQDMIAVQELIWSVKPDLIIETGIAHGGSLMLSASMLALLDMSEAIAAGKLFDPSAPGRKVLGIDVDIRKHNRVAIENHPMACRIQMVEGSSISPKIIEAVHAEAAKYSRILLCLDSNHTRDHVLAELNAYANLTAIGSYCIVFDTIVEDLPADMFPDRPWGPGHGPKSAVREFLRTHPEFKIDSSIQHKLLMTAAPDGFLRRIS
jgi:cephalosporin hydroxylase